MRPIPHPRHQPMLNGVDMDVVDVTREVAFIPNRMLPIPPLPNAAFALGGAASGNPFTAGEPARERRFDQPPTHRKIRIALGQRPYRMEMVRQHDNGVNFKRVTPADLAN